MKATKIVFNKQVLNFRRVHCEKFFSTDLTCQIRTQTVPLLINLVSMTSFYATSETGNLETLLRALERTYMEEKTMKEILEQG